MKVLILKDYPKIGKIGEIKEVSQGFARNFLIPQKIVATIQSDEAKLLQSKRQKKIVNQGKHLREEEKIIQFLRGRTWVIRANANEKGHLFAALHEKDIVNLFSQDGVQIKEHSLEIPKSIKSLGDFLIFYKRSHGEKEKISLSVLPMKK